MSIGDGESTKAWLKDQPHEVQVAFATRCALRSFPALARESNTVLRKLTLPMFRAVMNAAAIAVKDRHDLSFAARRAEDLLFKSRDSTSSRFFGVNPDAAVSATLYTAKTAKAESPRCANEAASFAFLAISPQVRMSDYFASHDGFSPSFARLYPTAYAFLESAMADFKALSTTIPADIFRRALWIKGEIPDGLSEHYEDLKSFWAESPRTWIFWQNWYEDMLAGRPVDWDFLRQVVLLPDEDWKAGPERIAERISGLQARYLAEKTPQAERIEFVPETGRFRAVPVPVVNPGLLGASLSQVSDALDDALAKPSNGLSERSREAHVLRRTVLKYGNDPQRIEMDLTTIHAALTRQIAREDLPPSEENLALQAACEEGARAVRATHPEIARNRQILSQQAWTEMTPEAKAIVEKALPVLTAISDQSLAEDFGADIPELVNDAIGPPPDWAPRLPGADPATRVFSRVSQMTIILRSSLETLDAVADRLGMTRGEVIGIFLSLVGIGLSLL